MRWRFASNGVAAAAPKKMKTTNIPPTVVGGFGAASTPVSQQSVSQLPGAGNRGRRIYHGATVDFDFKDAPIHDLLRIIADTGGVNIVVPDTIDAKVTVRLKRVPWDQALEVILASHGLWYRREGNLFRIAPRKELDAEDEAEAARRAAMIQAEAPKHEVVTLNYASADELRPKLEGMLSPKGKIEVDGRTNSLIINDVSGNRESIARLAQCEVEVKDFWYFPPTPFEPTGCRSAAGSRMRWTWCRSGWGWRAWAPSPAGCWRSRWG